MTCLQNERILIRALKIARCTRTLTFILSLTGRGNRNGDSAGRRHQNEISGTASDLILLSPLPVRERMKVRVRIQRAFFARESGFCSASICVRASKKFIDRAKHLVHTLKHLAIPESKHSITLRLEKRSTDFVFARSLNMLRPIEFDDKPSFSRAKIREVRSDRMLPAKFRAPHLTGPQMAPQDSFRVGLLASQAARVVLRRFDRAHGFKSSRSVDERQDQRKEQNLDSRAKDARCTRTLTFILSLTG
ncbi:MAG: hypothetical protein WA861_15475, partial [Candidatus Binatus sp.]